MTQGSHIQSETNRKRSTATRADSTQRAGRKESAAQGEAAAQTRSAYDRFKEFGGKRYTGMKVGRGHKWHYAAGDWVEKKVTPDQWEFRYSVGKRRAGTAPEGSGVPVGTEYHWYILADQTVTKLDANNYSTDMVGVKYKLAHKRADKEAWSGSDRAQLKRLIEILETTASELRARLEAASAKKSEESASAATRTSSASAAPNGSRGVAQGSNERMTNDHSANGRTANAHTANGTTASGRPAKGKAAKSRTATVKTGPMRSEAHA